VRQLRDLKIVKWRIGAHIRPVLGTIPAVRFGPSHVKRYIELRRSANASEATINRELSIVRRGFTLGAQQDPPLVQHRPTIPKLEEDNVRQGFLEPDQYEKLLVCLPEGLKALFVCAYHTGARKNELRRILWEQVDLASGVIRIAAGQAKGKRGRVLPI